MDDINIATMSQKKGSLDMFLPRNEIEAELGGQVNSNYELSPLLVGIFGSSRGYTRFEP